jgi:hypothetical protein
MGQLDADKIAFLQEIHDVRADCTGPWIYVVISTSHIGTKTKTMETSTDA